MSTITTPKASPRSTTPNKARRLKGSRCPTREGATQHAALLRSASPSLPPSPNSSLCFTPTLRVRGLSRPDDRRAESMTAASQRTCPVSIVHADTRESEFEIQGVQLLHEPMWGVLEHESEVEINLKGLVWNHAHSYLVPRSPDTPRLAMTPANRRERIPRSASVLGAGSPRTPPGLGDQSVVPRTCGTPHRRKQVQIFGWDDTERGQIPAVSAFHEGGSHHHVNPTETLAAPAGLVEASPEIWDYVGQG